MYSLDILAHPEREIYLVGRELVICEMQMSTHEEQVAILMPLVARLLHDFNNPVARVEKPLRMAELGRASRWYSLCLSRSSWHAPVSGAGKPWSKSGC